MGLWDWLTGRKQRDRREVRPPPCGRGDSDGESVRAVPISERKTVYSKEYMPRDREERSFILSPDGMPTGRLRLERDRLVIVTDDGAGMVSPSSARLYTLGVYCFRIRGVTYYEAAIRAGDFRPGTKVRLVREPDNEHDANAIAVYAAGARRPAGYVNKQNAKRLAKRLDAGEQLAVISLRGARPGIVGAAPWVLVALPDAVAHLRR